MVWESFIANTGHAIFEAGTPRRLKRGSAAQVRILLAGWMRRRLADQRK